MNFIFHIGSPKAGSTSIQAFLFKNRNILIEKGYFYIIDPHLVFSNIIPDFGTEDPFGKYSEKLWDGCTTNKFDDFIKTEVMKADDKGCGNLIFSAEYLFWFSLHQNISTFYDVVGQYGEIHTILFLRRQDQFLEAMWKNTEYANEKYNDFDHYKQIVSLPNYASKINSWSKISKNGLDVIPINSSVINMSIEKLFLEKIGLTDSDFEQFDSAIDKSKKNIGFNSKGIEFAYISRMLFDFNSPKGNIQKVMFRKYFPSLMKTDYLDEGILSIEERKEIMRKHEFANKEISDNHYDCKELFEVPEENGCPQHIEAEDIIISLASLAKIVDSEIEKLKEENRCLKKSCNEQRLKTDALQGRALQNGQKN